MHAIRPEDQGVLPEARKANSDDLKDVFYCFSPLARGNDPTFSTSISNGWFNHQEKRYFFLKGTYPRIHVHQMNTWANWHLLEPTCMDPARLT